MLENKDAKLAMLELNETSVEQNCKSPAQMMFGRRSNSLLTAERLKTNITCREDRARIAIRQSKQQYYYNRGSLSLEVRFQTQVMGTESEDLSTPFRGWDNQRTEFRGLSSVQLCTRDAVTMSHPATLLIMRNRLIVHRPKYLEDY
ncbi:hypothetical protein PR048_008961 [Dryococelus australis]|uniref:Uncharacterized protein n=1 Tax=Dryococelus australis TaxID=614101 RepID=A0ABQ9HYY0_9NEOP|nr:hypothetical protein PR048_008961 [Dryococelus australis]